MLSNRPGGLPTANPTNNTRLHPFEFTSLNLYSSATYTWIFVYGGDHHRYLSSLRTFSRLRWVSSAPNVI